MDWPILQKGIYEAEDASKGHYVPVFFPVTHMLQFLCYPSWSNFKELSAKVFMQYNAPD